MFPLRVPFIGFPFNNFSFYRRPAYYPTKMYAQNIYSKNFQNNEFDFNKNPPNSGLSNTSNLGVIDNVAFSKRDDLESNKSQKKTHLEPFDDYFFEVFGLKLYLDDILIICLLFFLYDINKKKETFLILT